MNKLDNIETGVPFGELEKNLIIKFTKGTGKGGQKRNKTSSTCQIIDNNDYSKYFPGYNESPIVIFCDAGRSQTDNREEAMRRWREKIEKMFYKKPKRTKSEKIERKIKARKDASRLKEKINQKVIKINRGKKVDMDY